MEYNSLNNINDSDRSSLTSVFQGILISLKHISVNKAISYLRYIPEQCRMHHNSSENRKLRSSHEKKFHPIKPYRGEIYNAFIEGDGTKINPNYQVRLSSAELADGKLDKEPSRIIVTDITTIDKARLGRRIGRLTPECLAIVDKLLKNHLEL